MAREWAYGLRYRSSRHRAAALPHWLRYYNARTGLPTGVEVPTGHAECFALAPEGGALARGTRQSVTLLSALDGQPIRELA